MNALAKIEFPETRQRAKPHYYVVLHTQPQYGRASSHWTEALKLLSALAEESPGYLGYEVQAMTDGREYAVTHWAAPEYIARWKKSCRLLEGDRGLLDRIFGKEGCIWPWMSQSSCA